MKRLIDKKQVWKIAGVFFTPVLLFMLFTLAAPGFGFHSLKIVFSQAVIPTLIGFGMAFGMIAGLFDLSAGARVVLAATVGQLLSVQFGIAGLIVGAILCGTVVGIVMGASYNLLRIPSLVLSLGFVMVLEIVSCYIVGDTGFCSIPSEMAIIGKTPWNYVICAVVTVIFYFLFYKTKLSYHIRVVGKNEVLAKSIGIKPKKVNFLSFVIGGVFLGIVGILQISYANSVSSVINMSSLAMVFQPMMGVMIGIELCALIDNLALNIIIGEICISLIFNGLIALGLPATMQDVFLGLFMLIVMAVSANRGAINWKRVIKKDLSRFAGGETV